MWNLIDEVGEEVLLGAVTDFYDRVFNDLMIGFLFARSDKDHLIKSLVHYMATHIGKPVERYRGPSIRAAHEAIPILPGHFDRRHQILRETLEEHSIPVHVRKDWLALDLALRDNVIRHGSVVRESILQNPR